MTQIRRKVTLLATGLAVVALAVPLTGAAPDKAAPDIARAQDLNWRPCPGDGLDPRQQCATVRVPMDYAEPDGEEIGIAVSRIPSERHGARRGALFLVPGGPGGSSIDDPSGKGQKLPQQVRDAYDLIGFDPRGLGRSNPVSCELEHGDLAPSKLRPWPAPDGSVTENMVVARRVSAACAANGTELMQHLNTPNVARDLDRIRAALGEVKLSAWGVSYGTYAAAVYAQLFPHRTDRIVLDSNDDPDHTRVARGWLAGHEQGVEDTFPVFAKWAAQPENPHRLAGRAAEVRPLVLRLAARLDREPIPWPGANPAELGGNVLRQTMLDSFYDPERFPALAKLILAAERGTTPPAPTAPPEETLQNVTAVSAGTICNDVAWPKSADTYAESSAASRAAYPLTAGMPRGAMACAAWPFPPRQQPVRITDRGPSNILLLQNARDAATPLSGARKLRAALGDRATMVVNDATGHGAYLANGTACGDRLVTRFLATGQRPERDTYCG